VSPLHVTAGTDASLTCPLAVVMAELHIISYQPHTMSCHEIFKCKGH